MGNRWYDADWLEHLLMSACMILLLVSLAFLFGLIAWGAYRLVAGL